VRFGVAIPRNLLIGSTLLVALLVGGTAWLTLVEGFHLLDALYQVVITVSTVGFEEVQPLDTSGRIFTMVFILFGIGIMFYVASAIVDELMLGRVVEALGGARRNRRLQHMHDHYVICGYGRVGEAVGQELLSQGVQVVVIDSEESHVAAARERGMTGVLGDATEEEVLLQANCDEAKAVVASTESDAANTFIALTVRAMYADVFIVAGARSAGAEARLKTAGADRVFSMQRIAGRRIALAAMQSMLRRHACRDAQRGGAGGDGDRGQHGDARRARDRCGLRARGLDTGAGAGAGRWRARRWPVRRHRAAARRSADALRRAG
jgi:voltage-gated potassium channel